MNESLKSATILAVNLKATPIIYNCLLLYKDGIENPNGACHISNLVGLAEAGVDVEIEEGVKISDEDNEAINAGKAKYLQYLEDLKKQQAESAKQP